MGYLQSKLRDDLCVNDIVHPTRIPLRQSGAARPCSTPPALRGVQGKARSAVTYCSLCSADRAESRALLLYLPALLGGLE